MKYGFRSATIRRLRFGAGLALVFGAAFALPAMFAGAAQPAPSVELDIAKFAFVPKEVTVAPGTRITWINRDETPHTVASDDKSFVSKGLDTDDKFEHTFSHEGDFNYICTVHPFMTGVVHVRKQ
ncbi:MAG TPA: cupredoxin family copper-binding protein [Casimicrobiaceae bacterium]